jgi:prepilin-type N-terminal cleavage/methylation domain-containing protein
VRFSRGFTLVELLIVMSIVGILLSISIAGYRHARIRGAEAAAVAALDTINRAQFAYMQTCGRQHYAPTLASLGVPPPGTDSPYLSPDLTQGEEVVKSGYLLKMSGTAVEEGRETCTGVTPVSSYQATADPTAPGDTGIRFFGTNTDRAIYADTTTFAGNMPETGAPKHGTELQTSDIR